MIIFHCYGFQFFFGISFYVLQNGVFTIDNIISFCTAISGSVTINSELTFLKALFIDLGTYIYPIRIKSEFTIPIYFFSVWKLLRVFPGCSETNCEISQFSTNILVSILFYPRKNFSKAFRMFELLYIDFLMSRRFAGPSKIICPVTFRLRLPVQLRELLKTNWPTFVIYFTRDSPVSVLTILQFLLEPLPVVHQRWEVP